MIKIGHNTLHNYLLGNVSEEETVRIIKWVEENPKHAEELKSLGLIYDATIWNQDKNTSFQHTFSLKQRKRRIIINITKTAAIFAIGFLLNSLIQYIGSPSKMQSLYTPPGQRAELTLEDGTKVWLNANSRITYPSSFAQNHRDISLEGEAYFKVTPNKHRPFTVNASGYKIRVLGTEFNVQAYDKRKYEIDLVKGSVHVTTPYNTFADLKPGKRLYLENNNIVKGEITHPEHFQWRNGLISFNQETLQDIFNKIELFYEVNITCQNKELLKSHYSGKFRIRDGVEHIMKVLQIDNNFKYTINTDRDKICID